MKKFIMFVLVAFASLVTMNAEQMNYSGKSNFGDNWSATLQGGVITSFNDFFAGHTMVAPVALVGVDKYVTPVVGFGADFRTVIGTGNSVWQVGRAFDMLNASGYVKFNLTNLFAYTGQRRLFEPVVYTGLGWGHCTRGYEDVVEGHKHANYMTWRSGCEFNFNLGKDRAWAVVVNPSVVWGNPTTTEWATKLTKQNGYFECTAGVVYHFETSNGTHSFTLAQLRDQAEIDGLNGEINRLREELAKKPTEVIREVVREVQVPAVAERTSVINFAFDSAELTEDAKSTLTGLVKDGAKFACVRAYASPEGAEKYNKELSDKRAQAVAEYLKSNGVEVTETTGFGSTGSDSNRIAVVVTR